MKRVLHNVACALAIVLISAVPIFFVLTGAKAWR